MDDPPVIPEWYPKFNIWYDFKRFEIAGAAAIIKAKMEKSDITSSTHSAKNIAEEISKEVSFAQDRTAFLNNSMTRLLAIDLLKELTAEIIPIVDEISKIAAEFGLTATDIINHSLKRFIMEYEANKQRQLNKI